MPIVDSIRFFDSSVMNVTATENVLPPLDGRNLYNVMPRARQFEVTQSGSSGIVWDAGHSSVTITHGLSCQPMVVAFDGGGHLMQPDVTVVDANTITVDFQDEVTIASDSSYVVAVSCLGGYGSSATAGGSLDDYIDLATRLNNALQSYNADTTEY